LRIKEKSVAEHQKMLSEMEIGEEGFCSVLSLYGGPALPVWGEDARVSGIPVTTRTFLMDSEVYPMLSPQATLRVKRLPIGFSVGFPDGTPTIKFRPGHLPKLLPVVGIDSQ
jgi:hypothetical protein